MTKFEIGTAIIVAVGTIGGGILAFGKLQGQIDVLKPDSVKADIESQLQVAKEELQTDFDTFKQQQSELMKGLSLDVETKTYDIDVRKGREKNKDLGKSWDGCFLTKVTGKFEGAGEQVAITRDEHQEWHLYGKSMQRDVAATARCIKYRITQ